YFCSQACHDTFVADRAAETETGPSERLTDTELADRASAPPERIALLVNLGILSPIEGTFSRQDVMRVRVVGQLESAGIEVEALAQALASGHLSLGYMEAAGRVQPRSHLTFDELADQIRIPFPDIERLYLAFGLPR